MTITNAERAKLDALRERLIDATPIRPEMETCGDCCGTGISGHPDSGYICYLCSGSGGTVPDSEALVVSIGQASDPALTYEACERIADALIAAGWMRKREDGQ